MWSQNPARLKTSNSYYAPADRYSLPSRISRIRAACSEHGICFPPSKADIRIHHEQSQVSAEGIGGLKATFHRIVRFVLSIFNLRLVDISSAASWARQQLRRTTQSSRVRTEPDVEAGADERPVVSGDSEMETIFIRTDANEEVLGGPSTAIVPDKVKV